MTDFGNPGNPGNVDGDAERQPTKEEIADALEAKKTGPAKERFQADRKASAARGHRKR